ncbi:spermidine synthase [Micrococcus flavus]|uniref:Spermidine synthase n=1 Tax=Micrococcus flavus TaxID=384602 RepID=A0A4Y8X315_9MICC|nr:fused MFS/spermidine synthase [Micrococcus flavus]MBB4883664.1 spermidine synthase [Micrococcus flavus]TFI02407.1 spermidine synthase [Micrococcus flavus]GGK48683.1 spermidine synthase [Micrococcus flavus]
MITPGTYPISSGVATIEPDPWTDGVFLLRVNGVESSQLNPDRPQTLGFEYMRWAAAVLTHRFAPGAAPLRVLHLGGAGCTFARCVTHAHPGAHQLAVELDAGLAALAREQFDLPRSPQLKIRVGEAGQILAGLRDATREVVFRDVFAPQDGPGAAPDAPHVTPAHLTGADAAAHAARVLTPGGVYVLNIGGGPDLTSVRREVAALTAAFAHVEVMADPAMLKGRRRGNVIAAASDRPLARDELGGRAGLARALRSDALPAQLVDDVAAFTKGLAPDPTPLVPLPAAAPTSDGA